MAAKDDYLVETLYDMGVVHEGQVDTARTTADMAGVGVVDTLIKQKAINSEDLIRARAMHFGMEVVDLQDVVPTDELVQAMPRHIARRYNVLPLQIDGNSLTVATSDPSDLEMMDGVQRMLPECEIFYQVASDQQILAALDKFYGGTGQAVERVVQELSQTQVDIDAAAGGKTKKQTEAEIDSGDDSPMIRLVAKIIAEGYKLGCSDVHIEPFERTLRIRYRIDGSLRAVDSPPLRLHPPIISRIKIMSSMSISEKRVPQDGRMQQLIGEKVIDFRVSCLPTQYGESIVMRILDKGGLSLGLDQLGFMRDDQETFERCAQMPDGILLVTGPTGSGKTTTLYSCLNLLNTPQKKIITVEDPVEYMLDGINQVQVNELAGMTFSAALRSMLRQAPNIIMLGEIRDAETGTIAVNASLTGHFVFSTLHTNDAPGAITRMIDLGIKPFLVSSATRCVMGQRLVRKICSKCGGNGELTEEELTALEITPEMAASANFRKGAGCKVCGGSGLKGRMGIFEVYPLNDTDRRMIIDGAPTADLRAHAIKCGMKSLRMDGVRKVLAGTTIAKEVISNTSADQKE